jgi:regulatory protein
MMKSDGSKRRKEEYKPRPVTQRYLENAATYYLGRYASCEENLKRVLDRKVRRRNEGHTAPSHEQTQWIDATAAKCVRLGLVDDAEYARARVFSMHRSGKSERVIRGTLKQKGVGAAEIGAAMQILRAEKGETLELDAAIAYARRRRFGPFRTKPGDADKLRKEMASFARAGYGYSLALKVVEAPDLEVLQSGT